MCFDGNGGCCWIAATAVAATMAAAAVDAKNPIVLA